MVSGTVNHVCGQRYYKPCLFLTTGVEANQVLELFGEFFVSFCQESGYDRILQVLGGTLRDFIRNLDALHDHLGTVYPGMQAPSFRVSDRASDGALILHYYSVRDGLEPIVIGIIKTVARRLLNTEVEMEIIKKKEFPGDHAEFVIKEISCTIQKSKLQITPFEPSYLSHEPKMSPATFCQAFPFHVLFDRNLRVLQAGSSVSRVVLEMENTNGTIAEIFELVRPHLMEFSFESILAHINTVFVLRTRVGKLIPVRSSISGLSDSAQLAPSLRLKGEMLYIAKSNRMLFLCSPSVGNLDDLRDVGLYLSDIPIHGATRDLILLSDQFKEDYSLTKQLEILTDKLKQTHRALAEEKQLTDELLYSVLPPSVANELRQKRPVKAEKFEMVTVMFSGIVDFSNICKNAKPMEIVQLLNDMYTRFDGILTDSRVDDVYKVRRCHIFTLKFS